LGEIERTLGEEGGESAAEHFDAAERALKEALSGSPDAPAAVHALASVFMRTGRTEAALDTLRAGIAARPDSALLYGKLGYAFRYAGFLDRSIAEYRLAQKLDSGYANLIHCERQVIKALIYSGRYNEAVDAFGSIRQWLTALGIEPDEKMLFYQGVGRYYADDVVEAVRSPGGAVCGRILRQPIEWRRWDRKRSSFVWQTRSNKVTSVTGSAVTASCT